MQTELSDQSTLQGDVAVDIYRIATRIKLCDERFRSMLMAGQIRSTYYSPRGQELISAGVGVNLAPDDYVCTTYRGLHDHIAKGVPLPQLWAEFLGRATGTCKGKGGPMHITSRDANLLLTTGIVGSGLPIATGLAWAVKQRQTRQVVAVSFGDGASNIGAFHEALNLASVWSLPVVFVCHNNRYAEHTPYAAGTSVERIAQRGQGYGMPGTTVDGNDAPAVHAAAAEAVARARAGEGPTLIEALTFRLYGHNMNDNNKYMLPGELADARAADPVVRLRAWLLAQGHADEAALASLEAGIQQELDEAVEFALGSPPPDERELWTDVYAEEAR